MKKCFFFLFLIFAFVNDSFSTQFKADSNSAVLHFYRVKGYLGSGTSVKITINGTLIGKLKNGSKIDFRIKSEGVIKITGNSASPKFKYSYKIQINHGQDRYIKIIWSSAYSFRIAETEGTDAAIDYNNDKLFKGSNPLTYFQESPRYPIKIYEKKLTDGSKKRYDMSQIQATGSGFFISSSGYIVTNFHVIEDFNKIFIRNINGDKTVKLEAIPIVEDEVNDLVILKIIDDKFEDLNTIPYKMNVRLADVGESVFALGYPLTTTMGREVKLTNGIISSKTGFDNNIVTYQISVPVQPGNSGGPLFDANGQLIGIICAIHTETDNVSYAVKSNYLVNLIDLLPEGNTFSDTNTLEGQRLVDQVKSIQKFVVLIEVY